MERKGEGAILPCLTGRRKIDECRSPLSYLKIESLFVGKRAQRLRGQRSVSPLLNLLWLLGNSLPQETIGEEIKMAAATARQIPVVNNVITDEDFEKLRTEGKVRKYLMQRGYLVGKHNEITCCF